MVAYTWWPFRPRASAVASPIPELVPVMSTDAHWWACRQPAVYPSPSAIPAPDAPDAASGAEASLTNFDQAHLQCCRCYF